MNITRLKRLIKSGESEKVEFKSSFCKEAIESVSAFANTKGGTVIVGVSNDGTIVGVSIGDESFPIWLNEIKQSTHPSIIPELQAFTVDGKEVVTITVHEFPVKPVAYKDRYFKRLSKSNHRLSLSEITNIHIQSLQLSWDSYYNKELTIHDLDIAKIELFSQKVKDAGRFTIDNDWKTFFSKLSFIKGSVPTHASLLLFGKMDCPHSIHIGRFKTDTYIIDDREIRGTLFSMIDEAMRFIVSHIKVAFSITGKSQRDEIFEYPLPAIRELLHNAVVHRDYTSPVDIQIKIYDTYITFFNPGRLFGDITIKQLERNDYQSRIRNKLIAEAFYLTKDIEKYGSGFIRIRNAIKEYPTMNFECEEIGDGFLAKLAYSKQKIALIDRIGGVNTEIGGVNTEIGGVNTEIGGVNTEIGGVNTEIGGVNTEIGGVNTEIGGVNTERTRDAIVRLIDKNPGIKISEIADSLRISKRTVERWVSILRKQGAIEYRGSSKTGGYYIGEGA